MASLIGNFNEGLDWGNTTVKAHFLMFLSYCFNTSAWGSTMSNYADQIRDRRDAIGSGVMIGLLVTSLFAVTGAIILPFMPEAMTSTPILMICQEYFAPALTAIYWVVVILAVVSTAPSFTFNISNRWANAWKTNKLSHKAKFFLILWFSCWRAACSPRWACSRLSKGLHLPGQYRLFAIIIPMFIAIPRVIKKDREEKSKSSQG